MMQIVEKRTMSKDALRSLCIKHDWYTLGTNENYSELLYSVVGTDMTKEKLYDIASNIIQRTKLDRFADCENNGITPEQLVMFELADICHSHFEILED